MNFQHHENGDPVIHVGDGAYLTFTGYSFLFTANHHEPQRATDTVSIDVAHVDSLLRFAKDNCPDAFANAVRSIRER